MWVYGPASLPNMTRLSDNVVEDIEVNNKFLAPTWEAHLIERASAGEQVAFELIVDHFRPVLLAQAMRVLQSRDDANDAVQETFVKAFRSIAEFDPARPIKPWLSKICYNCCIDIVRERKKRTESLEPYEYMLESADGCLQVRTERMMASETVLAAIKRLPYKYRQILLMRHYDHMDVNEIAERLKTPEGTVKSWLFRARALLKQDLSTNVV